VISILTEALRVSTRGVRGCAKVVNSTLPKRRRPDYPAGKWAAGPRVALARHNVKRSICLVTDRREK
jgi:hypothetical protein